jgi:RHS repeat-associated protein
VAKLVNDVVRRRWLYKDQLAPVAELQYDGSGVLTRRLTFTYGTRPNVPDYLVVASSGPDAGTYRVVSDYLGSPRVVVRANCTATSNVFTSCVVQRLDYDEFGRVTIDTNPGFQPFGFAGGLYEADTGLVRFGARDYDAFAGRWTARDPILFDAGQANLYAYVGHDPVNFIDPAGLAKLRTAQAFFARVVRLTDKGMKIVGDWLDWDDAVKAAKDGEDLLLRSRTAAKDLAEECGGGGATHHAAHVKTAGPKARPHYHPDGMDNHFFYQALLLFDFDESGDLGLNDVGEAIDMVAPENLQVSVPEGFGGVY